jgi:hypothetical protein
MWCRYILKRYLELLRENQALPVISIIRVLLSVYAGNAVLHHAVCSIFNYLFNLSPYQSKNTENSDCFFGLSTYLTQHTATGVRLTHTKGVTYSQLGGLFVESSVVLCQHRPCWAQGVCFIKGKCWISSSQYCMLLLSCLTVNVFCTPVTE